MTDTNKCYTVLGIVLIIIGFLHSPIFYPNGYEWSFWSSAVSVAVGASIILKNYIIGEI